MTRDEIQCARSGRLTAYPVQRVGKSGEPWLAMTLAVGAGEGAKFVSVALFCRTVPEMAERLHKGDLLCVEGRLHLHTWINKKAAERAGLSISRFHVVPLAQIGRRRLAKPRLTGATESKASATDTARSDGQRPLGAGPEGEIPF